ncbi:uncharacterized protein LOC110179494 [Drosophila serrata]|uniref:uncharacterized protein LOC110179494 n=1 Tax=Drosophila serrata TaxID=7274 RepID=UPI000A1D2DE3|nr:uncharacterized protein LOC110179494 [Drosophila serrata]
MSTLEVNTRAGLASAASVANLAKIVNIIESNVRAEAETEQTEAEAETEEQVAATQVPRGSASRSVRLASSSAPRRSACATSYVPKAPQLEEIVFAEPTCTERFARYLVIVIYLCGLCCLGFFLSIYHIFFWDSRMPPVFKGQKKTQAFG